MCSSLAVLSFPSREHEGACCSMCVLICREKEMDDVGPDADSERSSLLHVWSW